MKIALATCSVTLFGFLFVQPVTVREVEHNLQAYSFFVGGRGASSNFDVTFK